MSSIYDKSLGLLAGMVIPSSQTSTSWFLGKILTYKTRVHHDREGTIEEITGTCIATQMIEEPAPGREAMEAVIKIKMQLTPWVKPDAQELSMEAYREIENLQELTKSECKSTPRLIEYFSYIQHSQMCCPNGYIVFIVMEKIHGQDLGNFGSLSLGERDSVRVAFIRALWEFRNKGFYHSDPRRSNVIWDKTSQRCFIIDLEDAWNMELPIQKKITLDPVIELYSWGLNSGDLQSIDDHSKDDPMMSGLRDDGRSFDSLEELLAFLQCRRAISQG